MPRSECGIKITPAPSFRSERGWFDATIAGWRLKVASLGESYLIYQ
jgi:hypothetical protein